MSTPEPTLPARCDVLVVGAGPAGSACAQALARAGLQVAMVDQHAFPRDKVCGDGLIPDAHAALQRLGVHDEVMAQAQSVQHVSCFGPRGGRVDVPGRLAVLPRRTLDHILLRAAVQAGAALLPPARFEAPREDEGRVVGARLRAGDTTHEVGARWVVLATGAAAGPLEAAGLCQRRGASGVALRGYVRPADPAVAARIRTLQIVWHKALAGGYGWIFPAPGGAFNIGAGLTGDYGAKNLRQVFEAFCRVHPDARALVDGGTWLAEPKGAPLRCSLDGARWSRPGLLGTGEAIGSTYAFTGEGIGKALETGLLAAEAIAEGGDDPVVQARYAAALQALKPRFDLYAKAENVNRHPWLADLVIWRANRSPGILRRMSGVLDETQNPGRLLSWRGIGKLLFT
ncbi:NAD(P)/FAD-dependent oxidoreductase [Rubrivivax albus]|uniref:NAD(P)/FAD-dependent oxidoreductase n=1 Tax=Rubrivivax albus TaxID=2499835 RepID=A0A437JY35_9BURK|nr:NAD(P)/FAD-dependent oxidoreductase [Rubrivivax albus]RVT52561.1 NAD(P)/FAD-dependent oxidoreductase [Rubrivivax albus]